MKTKLPYWKTYTWLVVFLALFTNLANAQNCSVKLTAFFPVMCPQSADTLMVNSTGKPPYTYTWSASSGTAPLVTTTQQNPYYTVVTPTVTTTYTVILTDFIGCTSVSETVVKVATPFTTSISSTSSGCNGQNNGTATVTATGGTEPYSYYWSTSPAQTTRTATGLALGKYTVGVRDAGNCFTKYDSVVVKQADDFTINISASPTDSGKCKGYAYVMAQGNDGPFSYSWSNGATSQAIQNVCSGTYCVTVTNAAGCTKTACKIIENFATSDIKIAFSYVRPTCNGQCNGSITAIPTGGTAPYTYKWSNPTGATKAENTNLCAGQYTITVTDSQGRTAAAIANLEQGDVIVLSIAKGDVTCQGASTGYACVQASGGASPYKFYWNTGDSASCKQGLKAGDYSVTVIDSKGCYKTAAVHINDGAEINVIVGTIPSRADSCTGTAGVSVSPNATYTYVWTNGKTGQYIYNLCSGTYCVTVTNSKGCTKSACGFVAKDSSTTPPVQVTFTYVKPACGTACNGSITANVTGGTSPYTYKWSKPTGANKAENTNLCAGEYNVTVTDSKGKTVAATAHLEQGASITFGLSKKNASCLSPNSGSACVQTPSGGTAPYRYNWSTSDSTSCIQGLGAGNYAVTVTSANGCSQMASFKIEAPTNFTLSVTRVNATAQGKCDGSARATVSPSGTYTYSWSNGKTTQDIAALCKGTYCVTVSNGSGCSNSACVTISDSSTAPQELKLYTGKQNPSCNGNCNGMAYASAQGGTSPYTYKWSSPAGFSGQTNNNLCAGVYYVTVTDSKGVTRSAGVKLEQKSFEIKVVKQNASCAGKQNGYACVSPNNTNSKYTYNWSNGSTAPCIQGLGKGTYSVTVADSASCRVTASIYIEENSPSCDTTYQVKGIVYADLNSNCIKDLNEKGIKDITIKAEPGSLYAKTDGDGRYSFTLPKGSYTISQVINNPNLKQLCPSGGANYNVTTGTAPVIDGKDFGDQYVNITSTDCPRLYVNMNLTKTRPCSKGAFNVYYGNNGGKDIQNVVIKLTVDPQLTLLSSNLPWASQNGNVYTFNVGTVAAGKYMNIEGAYKLSCDAKNKDTKCALAHIYPDSTCEKPDSRWDGSHVVVKGSCTGDSVRFVIVNTGKNMAGTSNYRIYKDSSLYAKKDYMLTSGDSLVVNTPATGATYRMETDQRPYHPGKSHPAIAIEKCGKNGSSGYITAYRQDNEDDHEATSCFQVTTSFDPNDKAVIPSGVTSQYHYVDSTAALTYTINFQNTGNDTAFTVVVRDTLSKFLNVATIKTTESSHPQSFRIIGNNILEWTFNNINLPDSFTNETLSHGFVAFRIEQMKNNAIGSRINNSAAIYFDYNPPVLTNNTFVTVGDIQSITAVPMVYITTAHVSVAPNPFRDETTFTLSGLSSKSPITLQVYDIAGRLVKNIENISDTQFILNSSGMDTGLYLYKLINNQGLIATGKLTVSQ